MILISGLIVGRITLLSTSLTEDAVVKLWKENYQRHINAVKEYFKERDNLIVIDLDHDDNQKII